MVRDYLSACRFPIVEVGNVPVPRVILGHLPFIGESYQGPERNREYAARFSRVENTVRVMRRAVEDYGVTVFAAAAHLGEELPRLFYRAIEETVEATGVEIAVIPCLRIPLKLDGEPVDDYRRWLTYYEVERSLTDEKALREKYLNDPILQCREGWKRRFSEALRGCLKPYRVEALRSLQVDYRVLDEEVKSIEGFNPILVELGSETDFLAMVGRLDLLSETVEWLRGRLDLPVVLGVHHAGTTIPILERAQIDFCGYITPVNPLGALMLPDMDAALKAIRAAEKPVIAIKPLAGGRVPPEEALSFVYEDVNVEACMVGAASEEEVEEDFSTALRILTKPSKHSLTEEEIREGSR